VEAAARFTPGQYISAPWFFGVARLARQDLKSRPPIIVLMALLIFISE
jgi:hypothetical protein